MSLAAQPVHPTILKDVDDQEFIAQGITLRQWYAGLAMQGLCSSAHAMSAAYSMNKDEPTKQLAISAVNFADALLAALEKSQ